MVDNITNVNTGEFKKSRTIFQTKDVPGVSVTIDQVDTPVTMQPDGVESSNVDLAEKFASPSSRNTPRQPTSPSSRPTRR